MGRIARVVAPGMPHHVTQRGNRRQETFFGEDDCRAYLELMKQWCGLVCSVPVRASGRPPHGGTTNGTWGEHLAEEDGPAGPGGEPIGQILRRHEGTGRPLGERPSVQRIAQLLGRDLTPRKPGRPRRHGK